MRRLRVVSPTPICGFRPRPDILKRSGTMPVALLWSKKLAGVLAVVCVAAVGAQWALLPRHTVGPCTLIAGPLSLPDLPETSGLALGMRDPSLLWSQNDSGHEADIFAIDATGALRGRFAPAFCAAIPNSRLKVGHSMWLGAGQAAACRRPRLIARRRAAMRSISSALVERSSRSICRASIGRPKTSSSTLPGRRVEATRA